MSIHIGEILTERTPNNCQLTTGSNKVRTIDNCREVDRTLAQVTDLIDPQWKSWHAGKVMKLGKDRYMGIASDARRGKTPRRLFTYLLRNA